MSLHYRGVNYVPERHAVSGVETGLNVKYRGHSYPLMKTTVEQRPPIHCYQFRGIAYRR